MVSRYYYWIFTIDSIIMMEGTIIKAMQKKIITLEKGKSLTLPRGETVTFASHSHKRTYKNGPRSPLIVNMTYEKEGLTDDCSYYLDTSYEILKKEKNGWVWDDYFFILTEYEYDRFMKVELYSNGLPEKYHFLFPGRYDVT
jgi:hypothetical protein